MQLALLLQGEEQGCQNLIFQVGPEWLSPEEILFLGLWIA
jgi:hypothetical protein